MKLSIITVNYNDKVGLLKTVESVVSQTYLDYEYILIDGGSRDGSIDVIKQYEKNFSYWVSEPDEGIYNAMNKAVMVARGEYCIFMNAGDVFCRNDTLAKVFAYEFTESIVCGNVVMNGQSVESPKEVSLQFLFSKSICHQTAFIKTSLLLKYMYDEKYRIVADRKFFLQSLICDNCSYKSIPVDIVDYDINGVSSLNPVLSRLEYDRVLEELFPYRIRIDYGRRAQGDLYGDSFYEKLFHEIRLRNYKGLIYTMSVFAIRILSLFLPSAKYIKHFPLFLNKHN